MKSENLTSVNEVYVERLRKPAAHRDVTTGERDAQAI
jgi:hypothetical protein